MANPGPMTVQAFREIYSGMNAPRLYIWPMPVDYEKTVSDKKIHSQARRASSRAHTMAQAEYDLAKPREQG